MNKLSIFREYDIRGIFNKDLTEENVLKIGYLLGLEILKRGGSNIGVGYDARVHSLSIFEWLCSGLEIAGIKTYNLGEIPTPVGYFALFTDFDDVVLDSSIVITGSHNPPKYNGFKITLLKEPFFGEMIYALEREFYNSSFPKLQTSTKKRGRLDVLSKYIDFLSKKFEKLRGFNIPLSIDCGNGVAALGICPILDRLGIKYNGLFLEPNGNFPNHHPDPSEVENLKFIIDSMSKVDGIGIAFDGDGDRLAVLKSKDLKCRIYKGDELAIIYANEVKNPFVIGEVKCSLNMYESINKIGKTLMHKTGHSNLKVKLKETNAHMAFEVSGHMFFNDDYFGFDDATYAALRLLDIVHNKGLKFDEALESLPKLYSTDEIKIQSSEETKFVIIEKLKEILKNPPKDFPKILDIITIDGVRVVFQNGWGLIRASNTTPVLVVRFEAKSKEDMELYRDCMLSLLEIKD